MKHSKILIIFLAVTMLLLSFSSYAVTADSSDSFDADFNEGYAEKWLIEKIEKNELMSFKYNKVKYSDFIDTWEKTVTVTPDGNDKIYEVTYSNGDVSATCTIRVYGDFPALDWVGGFVNNGSTDSYPISDIYPLNSTFDIENPVLGYSRGSDGSDTDFEYLKYDFSLKSDISFGSQGGRSSSHYMPYFDVTNGEYGVIGAIGWTGQWKCTVNKQDNSAVRIVCGMSKTDISLYPAESMRTPSMVLLFFRGDCDYGHNLFRRLILSDYTARDENGDVVTSLPSALNCWGSAGEENILTTIDSALEKGFDFDILWIDAGWYGDKASVDTYDNAWVKQVGTWTPNSALYPNGFINISEKLRENDKKLLLWFEPERVFVDSVIYEENYDRLISNNESDNQFLFDFSNDEAAEYMTDYISSFIQEQGISWYRQDFNFEPLTYWLANDADSGAHRTGMTEIKYITNLYKYLDTLLAKNPGLMIDNCASGGRRLDIEMMKRSFPLWKTDYYCLGSISTTYDEACYTISSNLNYWLPLSCGGQSSSGVSDTYDFRSVIGSGMTLGVPGNNIIWWSERMAEFRNMSEYMTYDYYMLTDFPAEKEEYLTSLASYEYYSPEKGKGCIVAFRPQNCEDVNLTVNLKGLEPDSEYLFTCSDNGEVASLDGYSAMMGGFTINLNDTKESLLIYFEIAD